MPPAPMMMPSDSGSNSYEPSRSVAEAPQNRPGLGTGWGEDLDSQIYYADFRRATKSPLAVSKLFYNDEKGVKAMTGGSMWGSHGLMRDDSGRLEWGLKSGWGYVKHIRSGRERYAIGDSGKKYSIVLKNVSTIPVEAVVSVDGLDVVDGRAASTSKRGYIIQPGKTMEIKGFRRNSSQVAAFEFASVSDSYAQQRHGNTRNVGVIGLAVYEDARVRADRNRRGSASPFAESPSQIAR